MFPGLACHYLSLALGGKFGLKDYPEMRNKIQADTSSDGVEESVKDSDGEVGDCGGEDFDRTDK